MPQLLPVSVRENLSYGAFFRDFVLPKRPVVVRGEPVWLESEEFGPSYLRKLFGSRKLDSFTEGIGGAIGLTQEDIESLGSFGRYLDLLEGVDDSPPVMPAQESQGGMFSRRSAETGAPYLTNLGILANFPELVASLPMPRYFLPNWLETFSKEAKRLARGELFIGPASTSYGILHFDKFNMHVGSCQLYGRKKWWLFPPSETPKLYAYGHGDWYPHHSPIDVETPDLARYPLYAGAEGWTVTLEPGDILFCPRGWWHNTRNLEVSISSAFRIVNFTNIVPVVHDFARARLIDSLIESVK